MQLIAVYTATIQFHSTAWKQLYTLYWYFCLFIHQLFFIIVAVGLRPNISGYGYVSIFKKCTYTYSRKVLKTTRLTANGVIIFNILVLFFVKNVFAFWPNTSYDLMISFSSLSLVMHKARARFLFILYYYYLFIFLIL